MGREFIEGFPEVPRSRPSGGHPRAANRGEWRDGGQRQAHEGTWCGIFEIALRHRTDAYRIVYAVQLGADIYALHAFQKKSKTGIKTPKQDVDLVKARLRQVRRS